MHIEKFVLASTSKIRQEILKQAKFDFVVKDPAVNESLITAKNIKSLAYERASAKALAVAGVCGESSIVLGCDQTLDVNNRSFDKPQNIHQAQEQLAALSGREHFLHSAYVFAVCLKNQPIVLSKFSGVSSVAIRVRKLSRSDISNYLNSYDWRGSVGSYKIESGGAQLITDVKGDNFSVMGLPIFKVFSSLRSLGVDPLKNPVFPCDINF